MSEQILFDRLTYIDRLKRAGIAEDQARAHADAMDEALREAVATKAFVRQEIVALKYDLTVRGGLIAAAVVAILASLKFFS